MRLIDADALMDALFSTPDNFFCYVDVVKNAPTVVTQCKDCKHYNGPSEICRIQGYAHDENWYCADAERRDKV